MIEDTKIIALIPARGGSKGLPNKNINNMNGKPLIAWTIEQAKNSKYLDRILVSTDSKEIALVAEDYGCRIPFFRPPELAQDDSPTSSAVIHALDKLEQQGDNYDYIMLLEPTSPLRKRGDIDCAIERLCKHKAADGIISIGQVHLEHPSIVKRIDGQYMQPFLTNVKQAHQRQQLEAAFFPYGVIYMIRINIFRKVETFYSDKIIPYYIERWQNYEIDDIVDFYIVEMLMKKYKDAIYG